MVRHDAALARWLHAAVSDAEARGLPELKPLLEGLAESTRALRAADAFASRLGAAAGASATHVALASPEGGAPVDAGGPGADDADHR